MNYAYFQKNNILNSKNTKQAKFSNFYNNSPPNLNYNQKYYENNNNNYFTPYIDNLDIEEEKNDDFDFENDYKKEQKDIEKQFNISNKVIQDFKKIMEQTKIIKDKILLKSKDIENNIFNKSYFAPKINNFSNIKDKKDYNPDINYKNNENEFDIKFDDDYLTNNSDNNENIIFPKNKNINISLKEKLIKRNKLLSEMNSQIMLKNNEMESKILLYENKQNKNLLLSE